MTAEIFQRQRDRMSYYYDGMADYEPMRIERFILIDIEFQRVYGSVIKNEPTME